MNPRAGSSSCGDETPRSSSTPSTCAYAEAREDVGQLGKPAAAKREAGIGDRRAAAASAAGSRSIATSASARAEDVEHRARMAAAAERRVDVNAVVAQREPGERFGEQNGNVPAIEALLHRAAQRLKPSSPARQAGRGR